MVGPWALWTHGLTFYGLPSERAALTAKRVGWFVFETFKIFPPVLLAIAVVGVIAVLATPKAWRDDLIVLGLLGVGHLTFLILSPVVPEQRYLLLPAAVFLITAFAGFEVLGLISQGLRESTVLSIGMAVATLFFVAFEFIHITRFPPDRLRSVVAFIVKDPARSGQRIVVPPDARRTDDRRVRSATRASQLSVVASDQNAGPFGLVRRPLFFPGSIVRRK